MAKKKTKTLIFVYVLWIVFMQHEIFFLFDSIIRWIIQSFNNNFFINENLNASFRFTTSLTTISFNQLTTTSTINEFWCYNSCIMIRKLCNFMVFFSFNCFSFLFIQKNAFLKVFHSIEWIVSHQWKYMKIYKMFFLFSISRKKNQIFARPMCIHLKWR